MAYLQRLKVKLKLVLTEENINSFHLFRGQFLQYVISFIANILLFRQLDINNVGIFYTILAYTGLLGVLTNNWLRDIVIRELVLRRHEEKKIIGSTFFLILISSFITFFLSILLVWGFKGNGLYLNLTFLTSLSFLFAPFNIIQFYFDANLKSKFNSKVLTYSNIVVSIFKIIVLVYYQNLYLYVIVHASTSTFLAFGYVYYFNQVSEYRFTEIKVSKVLISIFFNKSYPLIFSNLAVVAYFKIDQILLTELSNTYETAKYAASLRFIEVFYVIPMVLYTSFYPNIVKAHERDIDDFNKIITQKSILMIRLFILLAIPLSISSFFIGELFYGSRYENISTIILGLILGLLFVNLSVIKNAFVFTKGLVKINTFSNIIACVFNVVTNFILLPYLGALGAVFTSVLTYFLIHVLSCFFFVETRPLGEIFIYSLKNVFNFSK